MSGYFYRVGRRCPWNVYRTPDGSQDPGGDLSWGERFAVTFGENDGQLVADALNANAVLLPGDWTDQLYEAIRASLIGDVHSNLVELVESWRVGGVSS